MLNDVQNRKIARYRKLAAKNKFCKYIAVLCIIWELFWNKFMSVHRRRLIVLGELCLVTVVFVFSTSFAAPVISDTEPDTDIAFVAVDYLDEVPVENISDENTETVEEDFVAQPEDMASLEDLIETSKTTVVTETIQTDGMDVSFDKDAWNLLLVNKQHTIPEDYQFPLGVIKGSMRCDERIIDPLTQMFSAAKEDGITLIVCSPYRDMARQEYLFERKLKTFIHAGMSYVDAYKKASITVTVPGASEHQVGLAVDIISDTYSALDTGFADTPSGKWLAENSWKYGFILRYPLGKEEITGIQYEPWHFRYVGVEAAKVITEEKITLEEFVENL